MSMVTKPVFNNIAAVLEDATGAYPDLSNCILKLRFNHREDAWVTVYSVGGSPYFDFAYSDATDPKESLAQILVNHTICEVIDWSPGRLTCIQAKGAGISQLAEIITAVVAKVFGLVDFTVEVFYEEFGRA